MLSGKNNAGKFFGWKVLITGCKRFKSNLELNISKHMFSKVWFVKLWFVKSNAPVLYLVPFVSVRRPLSRLMRKDVPNLPGM